MIVGVLNVHPAGGLQSEERPTDWKGSSLEFLMKNFHTFRALTNKQAVFGQVEPTGNHHSQTNISIKLVAYNSKKKDSSGIVIFPNFWCENFFHFSGQKPVAMWKMEWIN